MSFSRTIEGENSETWRSEEAKDSGSKETATEIVKRLVIVVVIGDGKVGDCPSLFFARLSGSRRFARQFLSNLHPILFKQTFSEEQVGE